MEEETKTKIRAAMKFILGDPDPTTKDRERIKKDPDIKNQMQKMMGWRYPGQRQLNSGVAMVVGILGFVVFIAIICISILLS
ncbi:MAG: hypothetical protein J6S86_03630 [Alphaproteobacteria bacterium]|nr:hypothetical protein [Alphaproteobacteria bacterium]